MSNLLEEMESDVTTPTIGDNSLKEMALLEASMQRVAKTGQDTLHRIVKPK